MNDNIKSTLFIIFFLIMFMIPLLFMPGVNNSPNFYTEIFHPDSIEIKQHTRWKRHSKLVDEYLNCLKYNGEKECQDLLDKVKIANQEAYPWIKGD